MVSLIVAEIPIEVQIFTVASSVEPKEIYTSAVFKIFHCVPYIFSYFSVYATNIILSQGTRSLSYQDVLREFRLSLKVAVLLYAF